MIFTRAFWVDALERSIKTAAQSALAAIGLVQVSIVDLDAAAIAGVSATAALVSLLTSIASTIRPGTVSPASLVKQEGT